MAGIEQLSVAVAVPVEGGVVMAVHSIVTSDGQVIAGGVTSTIVTVAVHVVEFRQSSVAVKVTTCTPVAPHPSVNPAAV